MPLPTPPVLPSGQDIYDSLMAKIEPDLVSATVNSLEQKYAGETPEQKAERMLRYQSSFEEYDRQYEAYIASLTMDVHSYRKQSLTAMEQDDRTEETNSLHSLESSILTQ